MSTVLFANEFGAGFGHLNRLIAVAKRLPPSVTPVFAVRDLAPGRSVIHQALGDHIEVRQGALWPAPTDPESRQVPTHTFADVIRLFGFHNKETLGEKVRESRSLVAELAPKLIVADFAPTLRLASRGFAPTVVVGSGYTIPPAGLPLPSMRPWDPGVPGQSRSHERELLRAANRVGRALGHARLEHFSDLLNGEGVFPCTLAELDPYTRARTGPVYWPFNIPNIRPAYDNQSGGPAVFCYLSAEHPALDATLSALSSLGVHSQIYVSGAEPRAIASRCSPRVAVRTRPAAFDVVLPGLKLFIHHGGLGSSYAGLLAGVPQLVVAHNLEQGTNAFGLERLGVAKWLRAVPPPDANALGTLIDECISDLSAAAKARSVAEEVAARRSNDPVGEVIASCASYL